MMKDLEGVAQGGGARLPQDVVAPADSLQTIARKMEQPVLRCRYRFEFGPFGLDQKGLALLRGDQVVPLPPKALQTLLVLVQRAGEIVTKEELLRHVWPDTFVEEGSLTQNVSALRQALQDEAGAPYIETVPRRGYRFARQVRLTADSPTPLLTGDVAAAEAVLDPETVAAAVPRRGGLAELRRAYRRIVEARPARMAGMAVVVGLVGGLLWLRAAPARPASVAAVQGALVVVPFKATRDTETDPYLGFAVADGVVARLKRLPQLVVRPMSEALRYREPGLLPREIAVAAQSAFVVHGSLSLTGDAARLNVELVGADQTRPLWSVVLDVEKDDVISVQSQVAEDVANALGVRLSEADRTALWQHETADFAAYERYAKGRYVLQDPHAENSPLAIRFFEEALVEDPGYAGAYANLAASYVRPGDYLSLAAPQDLPKALAAARRAVELEERLSTPHWVLGLGHLIEDHDWLAAELAFRRANHLGPNDVWGHYWYGVALVSVRRIHDAITQLALTAAHDPHNPRVAATLAAAYYFDRQYARAIEVADSALELEPRVAEPLLWRALAHAQLGHRSIALADLQEAMEVSPADLAPLAAYGSVSCSGGDRRTLDTVLARLTNRGDPVPPQYLAELYAGAGDRKQALSLLSRCCSEECSSPLIPLLVDPRFDELHRTWLAEHPTGCN